MTHAEMNELYELYALGVLEPELAADIDKHLVENCEYCVEHVRQAFELTAALAEVAEPVKPPKHLRQRVLASVRPPKRATGWMFSVGALSAACAGLLIFSVWAGNDKQTMREQLSALARARNEAQSVVEASKTEVRSMRDRLTALTRERNELRAAVEILSRPETRAVQFGLAENVPHGRVLVNRNGALVFVGSRLPALASDRTFELWVIPKAKGGAPQPAGLFRSNAAGGSVAVSSTPVNTNEIAAVAVTVEPLRGSSAPTTKPFLVVPLG